MSIEFLLTSLIVILILGRGVVYTVATGLAAGRRTSFATAFGCTLGILPALFASVVGLAALLHASALLFQVRSETVLKSMRRTVAVAFAGFGLRLASSEW